VERRSATGVPVVIRPPLRVPPARAPQYAVEFHGDVRIPSSVPGLTLGGDLYLPKTRARVPALVTLHTGRKDGLGGVAAGRYLRYFAERGYAVLYVDCFGIGTSEGTPRPILSPGEVADGVAVVEWAAGQPWCTGRVGMWGLSHGGMTTLAVAAQQPPHLKAIFPVMGWTDVERELVHPAGQRGGIGMFGHLSLYHIFCALMPPLRLADKAEYEGLWKERLDRFEPWFVDSWRHPPGDPVWAARRIRASRITAPALCVAGWRDLFCDGMIAAYQQINAPKRLLVGPWLHTFPDVAAVAPFPSATLACAWFDRWLRNAATPAYPKQPATFYLQGDNARWVAADSWPPRSKGDLVFVASSAGRLCRSVPAGSQSAVTTVTGRGDQTVGAYSGLTKHPVDRFGYPLDQHDDDARSLSFTSTPLAEPLLVAGRPTVRLVLASGSSAGRCVVKVTDVDERDRSVLVTMGTVELTDNPQSVQVRLDPTCYRFAAGHRIRLVLADSDIPRLWPDASPGRLGVRVIHWPRDHVVGPTRGRYAATALSLPVADPDALTDVVEPAPQRATVSGAATDDRWEISRDHLGDEARVTVEKHDRVRFPGSEQDFLTMRTSVELEVRAQDPAAARMRASGEKNAVTADGDRVGVRARIDMGDKDAAVSAEILLNGNEVFAKEWKLP
jgi:putative CocE/NonD family hydrolase